MSKFRAVALVVAALVAGMVLGSFGSAIAGPRSESAQPAGAGARMGGMVREAGVTLADIVGSLTGTSAEEVRAQRAEGTSLADIAEKNGVSADKVVDEAVASRKAFLDEAVAEKRITQEQADLMLDRMTGRLNERVGSDGPCAGGGACGGGGGGACAGGNGACGGNGMGGRGFGAGRGGAGGCGGSCATATQ